MSRFVLAFISVICLVFSPVLTAASPFSLTSTSSHETWKDDHKESWWEIKIHLVSRGKYKYTESKTSYLGKYTYTIHWIGCIERDQEDFILYYEDSELVRWEPLEEMQTGNSKKIHTIKKFSVEPSLDLNYILRRRETLHFDFLVKGFDIPQHGSAGKTYLHLPASRENSTPPSDLDYDLHISKGSNKISISEDIINQECVKKEFHWTWQHQKWFGGGNNDPHLYHFHDVDVEVFIIRHSENQPDFDSQKGE